MTDSEFYDALDKLLDAHAASAGDFNTVILATSALYQFTRSHGASECTAIDILEGAIAQAALQWRQGAAIVGAELAIENAKKENKNEPIQPDESA